MAWFLQIGWLAAMGLEAVFLIFFFFYSTLFHWCYDKYQPYKTWFTMQATKIK
ncbi:chlorhexidine efflux transporter [Shewanella oncorhynchi]|uniref:chlorhexidine efflux transporter n=1 Tax=Shewanella oncorhynchi TaxID=2726434 RepID=UPI003D7B6053